jgi:hypothetical protein
LLGFAPEGCCLDAEGHPWPSRRLIRMCLLPRLVMGCLLGTFGGLLALPEGLAASGPG